MTPKIEVVGGSFSYTKKNLIWENVNKTETILNAGTTIS